MSVARRRSSGESDARMGPLALFTLIAIICLSVLAVLCVSTANATLALAERRATATDQLYLDEAAAQTFLAALDEQLGTGADPDAALQSAQDATAAVPGAEQLEVTTSRRDDTYSASFDCGNGRQLNVTIRWNDDGGYRIEQWRMTSVQNEEPPIGTLLGGSRR